MNCPICGAKLRKQSNVKENGDLPSIYEVKAKCTGCKRYKYELLGPARTTWVNDEEYYDLYYEHKKNQLSRIVFWAKLEYKIGKFFQKMKKLTKNA